MSRFRIFSIRTTMQTVLTKIDFAAGKDSWPFIGQIIVFLLMIITFQAGICNADDKFMCNGAKYTQGSELESNLNRVLTNLAEHTSQTGFNTSAYGQIPNRIYGLLQCRGDATINQCSDCSQQITTNIRKDCVNSVGGRVWYDLCYFRYENYSFIGRLDTDGWDTFNQQNASNPDIFKAALGKLFNNLTAEISSGSASNRYASGSTTDSPSQRIFALVQCWRDISMDNCTQCLSNTIATILKENVVKDGGQAFRGSCIARYDSELFFNNAPSPSPSTETPRLPPPPTETLSPPPKPTPSPTETPSPPSKPTPAPASNIMGNHSKGSSNKIPIILGVLGGLLMVFLAACFWLATRRRLKPASSGRQDVECIGNADHRESEEASLIRRDQYILFKMEELIDATENFHDDNKLGEGGFGPVYKGTTTDGTEIAVKKLSLTSMQGNQEFMNEVKLVAKIKHRNLVNLLGCCIEGSERLLVYEYLANKSLDTILLNSNKRKHLDWRKRYNIILGVARGLVYLHEDSQLRIIHRDIKLNNILLDEKLNAKIADFGLARIFPQDESHVHTRVAGTYGYMAPEYAMQGHLSVKADVYSFGVLLLELLSGRKNMDLNLSHETQSLLAWVWESYKRGNVVEIIDPSILETCDENQALRCIQFGLLCTEEDTSLRPLMSTVSLMLSRESVTLPDPTKPAFVKLPRHDSPCLQNENDIGLSLASSSATASSSASSYTPQVILSNADVSITVLVPR